MKENMGQVPRGELPGAGEIRKWALENLPEFYTLRKVRFYLGSEWPDLMPDGLEITIEFESHLDEALEGSYSSIQAYQDWAGPLAEKIRARWHKDNLRIFFSGKDAEP